MAFTLGVSTTSGTELLDPISQRGGVLTVDVNDQCRLFGPIGIDDDGDSFEFLSLSVRSKRLVDLGSELIQRVDRIRRHSRGLIEPFHGSEESVGCLTGRGVLVSTNLLVRGDSSILSLPVATGVDLPPPTPCERVEIRPPV